MTSEVAVLTVRLPQSPATILSPRVSNGVFTATLAGDSNRTYMIETSANLTNWMDLLTVSNATGQVTFTDTNVPSAGTFRGYRARSLP